MVPETPFCKKTVFLVDFGTPGGAQKWQKNLRVRRNFWVWEAIWRPFGVLRRIFLDFECILGSFWTPPGTIFA